MIPKGNKDASGIEGDDRPASLSVKRGDDKSDNLLPRMQDTMGNNALTAFCHIYCFEGPFLILTPVFG